MTVLFILSSHDDLGSTGLKTGTWLEELLVPYYRFVDSGVQTAFASPKGGEAPIDPASVQALADAPVLTRYRQDGVLAAALQATARLADIDPDDYDAVIFPGGHGPLFDLRGNAGSLALIENMHAAGKPIGVICHAGCVLIDARDATGAPLVAGRAVTAFTDSEERAVGLDGAVPYVVEHELRNRGADFSAADDWAAHVVVDGRLITGQNPASAGGVADEILRVISA